MLSEIIWCLKRGYRWIASNTTLALNSAEYLVLLPISGTLRRNRDPPQSMIRNPGTAVDQRPTVTLISVW
jgi:hypothetical protein